MSGESWRLTGRTYTYCELSAEAIKGNPTFVYLAEFRSRPVIERRAASIHAHVDGESGPSSSDLKGTATHDTTL
jgi:hypothetical protein